MQPKLYTLPNGLRVVLEENHTAPVISFNALVQVGSADETDAEAGISHLIEHMLFKGTPTRPVGTIARDVEGAGGDINAYTSFDQTVYYINMATRFADKGLEILADAVQNPSFDAKELEREKEVVLEEIRRERDNPGRWVGEILFQKAFFKHSYGRPIIGFDKTVKSFSQGKLFEYFHRWYTPQNMTFIVVGDCESEKMLEKIEHAFKNSKPKSNGAPLLTRVEEPPQLKARISMAPDNIQSIHFNLGFHIPEIIHADVPSLDLLSHILGAAKSSRLEQILKEKKRLVQNIYSYAYTPKDPGLMMLGGQMNTAQAPQALETMWEIIEELKEKGLTNEELKRAKHNIRAHEIYEKETVGGQAGKIAYFLATAQSLDFEEQYYQRLQNVSVEEVMQAARKYLTRENRTAAFLIPQKEDNKNIRAKIEAALEKPAKAATKKGAVKVTPLKTEPHLVKLSNGVKLILKEDHDLPIIALCATSLGGLLAENKTNNGINSLISQCWTKGTQKHSALQIAQAVEEMAGQIDAFSGKNSLGLKAEFLSDHLKEGLDLFCEVLLEPKWDPKEVAKEKKLALEGLKNQEDNLSTLAFIHFQKALFPSHPYGMRGLGSKQSIPQLTPNKLKSYYQKLITAKNMVIGVVGDFDSEEMVKHFQKQLKKLPNTKPLLPKRKEDPKPKTLSKIITKKEKEQAHIVLGFKGTTMENPDHPSLTVLNAILSGQGGRLFLELRDRLSLAYSVTSVLLEGVDPGYFAVYIGTDPSKIPTALKGIEAELKKITTELVSAAELERIKNYLVGTYELELQKNASLAQGYAFNELYGMGYEEVRRYPEKILKVTREDILRVARKYIDMNAYILSIVEP